MWKDYDTCTKVEKDSLLPVQSYQDSYQNHIKNRRRGGALLRVRKKSTFSRQELRDKIDATPALYKRPGFGTEPNTYSPFAMRASFHLLAEIGLFSCPELLRVSEGKMESNVTSRLYRLPIEVSLN